MAKLLGAGMDVHESRRRAGNVEQRIALAGGLREPGAEQDDQVAVARRGDQSRIRADADIPRVVCAPSPETGIAGGRKR